MPPINFLRRDMILEIQIASQTTHISTRKLMLIGIYKDDAPPLFIKHLKHPFHCFNIGITLWKESSRDSDFFIARYFDDVGNTA